MSSSWWLEIIVVETDEEGNWPVSWNIFWGIFILLSFFTSLYAVLLLYHRHDKWCKLREGRRWTYSVLETITSCLLSPSCCLDGLSPPLVLPKLLDTPIAFSYRFWPCYLTERRSVEVKCATLWRIPDPCNIYHGPKPTELASTRDDSLCVTLSNNKEENTARIVLKLKATEDGPTNHNEHCFSARVTLSCPISFQVPGETLKLEIVFVTNNADCSSSSSDNNGTFSSLMDNRVSHRICLVGTS